MENLDIEKLERKNIYPLPDDVFEKMQAKVLQETIPTKQGKIIKLNWIYSAAAAIALLFGLTFFINNDPNEIENSAISQNPSSIEKQIATNTLSDDKVNIEQKENNAISEIPMKVDVENNKTTEVKSYAVANQNGGEDKEKIITKKAEKAEIPMDQIIASFTTSDLADLGRNTEQDIYLDLYN